MSRSWEEMLSNPIEGEELARAQVMCGDCLQDIKICGCDK